MKRIALILLLTGCAQVEERQCIDYQQVTYERQKCVAFYGQLICADTEVTELVCVLYED